MYEAVRFDAGDRLAAFLFAGLLIGSVFASCVHDPVERIDDDLAIVARVESRLEASPDLRPFDLTADAHEGIVVLRGRVEDDLDRRKAERLVRDTPGTVQVVNAIELVTPPYEVDSPFQDAWIATRVKARLVAHPEIDAARVSVDARRGVVVLSGSVSGEADRDDAEALARTTRGVVYVVNRVQVAPTG